MVSFVLIPPRDHSSELLALVPQFRESREYQSLDADSRGLHGLVFAGFAKFLESSLHDHPLASVCVDAIEHFASSNDLEAENLLVTGVFENLVSPDGVRALLGPIAGSLYDRWM